MLDTLWHGNSTWKLIRNGSSKVPPPMGLTRSLLLSEREGGKVVVHVPHNAGHVFLSRAPKIALVQSSSLKSPHTLTLSRIPPQFGSVVVVVKVNEVVVPVTVVVVLVWVRVVVAVTVVGTHDPQSTGHKVCMDTPARSTLHLSADCVWHPVGSGNPLHTAVVVVVDVVVQASHKAGQLATIVGPQNRSVQSAGPKSRHPSMSKLPAQFAMVLVVVVVVLTTVVVGVEVSVVTKHRSRSPPSADSKSVFKIPAAASHPACDSKTT